MMKHKRFQEGFTLVELLVVIAIIGILATLLLLQLGVARQRARDAARIAHVNQVRTAIELYFDDQAEYPQLADYTLLGPVLAPKYITLMPVDPLNTAIYTYRYAYDGKVKFHLWAELEQTSRGGMASDADIDSTLAGWVGQAETGSKEACLDQATIDCVYDQGQN